APPPAQSPLTNAPAAPKASPNPHSRPAPVSKLPVPSDAAIKAGENQVRDVLGAQIKAARTPADRVKLSEQMRQTAAGTADPGAKCALLHDAETLGAEAGDVDSALAAHADLAAAFELGNSKLASEVFLKLGRAPLNPDAARKVCTALLSAAQDAVASDQYDVARQLTKLALPVARESNDHAMSEGISSLNATINTCDAEQKRIAPARAALAANPNDPAANAAVGRFYCLTKGDWAKGLSMLARGNDPVLKPLAAKDLSQPSSASGQAALADAWWAYADTQPQLLRGPVHLRAGYWYDQASAGLSGLARLKANQRAADYRVSVANQPKPQDAQLDSASANGGSDRFTSALQIVQAVPQNMYPPTMAGWTDERRTAVNDELKTRAVGHPAILQTVVQTVFHGNSYINAHGKPTPFGQFTFRVDANFGQDQQDAWSSVQDGNAYLVSGRITACYFTGNQLLVYLTQAHLVTPEQAAAEARKPAEPAGGGPAPVAQASTYTSLDQIVQAIPVDLAPATREEWKDQEKTQKFVDEFMKRFGRKTVTFQMTVAKVRKSGDKPLYASDKIRVGPTSLTMNATFDPADPAAPELEVGKTYTLTGKILGQNWGSGGIGLTASKCKIVSGN
ncbi:MAG TPA: hypothetical protein VLJ39_08835, partial [Tepidisphaeraceae bacterium]|nr:hypothetical protein [Tepidisphaeraceae bacterium]